MTGASVMKDLRKHKVIHIFQGLVSPLHVNVVMMLNLQLFLVLRGATKNFFRKFNIIRPERLLEVLCTFYLRPVSKKLFHVKMHN